VKKRTLLLLDFDGTIADTAAVVLDVGNEVLQEIGKPTVPADKLEEMRNKSPVQLLREYRIPLHRVPSIVNHVRESLKQRLDDIEPVEGMIDIITRYADKEGVDVGLLSSNSLENVEYFLNKHGFRDRFIFRYGGVGVFAKYTKIRSIKRSEGKNAHLIAIGDEVRDVQAARIAQVDNIAVDWGMNSRYRLEKAKAQDVVGSVEELDKTISKLIKSKG
jgi:phosphoglycolate phosphatase